MSAPTPAPGDESPREGYYPDPSIPGYVRYWNGASWVPGTSRPAPQQGEATPEPPPGSGGDAGRLPAAQPPPAPGPVDETGPMYFDEVGEADGSGAGVSEAAGSPQPTPVWQADTSRQTGFGGDRDRRVSWGGEDGADPRTPADRAPADRVPVDRAPEDRVPEDPRRPAAPDPTGGALPGMRDGSGEVTDGTVTMRAGGRGGARTPRPRDVGPAPAQADGTMAIRAVKPEPTTAPGPAPVRTPTPNSPNSPSSPTPQNPSQAQRPNPETPLTPGPGGGSASWAQQVHQLAQPDRPAHPHQPQRHQQPQQQPQQQHRRTPQQPQYQQQPSVPAQLAQPAQPTQPAQQQGAGPDQPVVPWKPPVEDPFQHLAQASARPAGLGKRFAARLLDTVVLGALVGAIGFPLATRALDHIDEKIQAAKQSGETVTVWLVDSTTAGLFGAVLAAFLVLGFVLEALPTAKWGRTLGKKLCGLEVRDIESHGPPTIGAALRRWLVYGVLGVLLIGVVNVLWCLIDRPWRQCWHDKAARTFVAG